MRHGNSVLATALGIACLAGLAAPAWAQNEDPAQLRSMLACGAIKDKSDRLACYDAAARPPAAAAASATQTARAPVVTPQQRFGMETVKEARRAPDTTQVDTITARAIAATDTGIGHWLITLDNGARWRMIERQPDFFPPRPNEEVRIRRGRFGGYLLDVGKQASVRVTRVQ